MSILQSILVTLGGLDRAVDYLTPRPEYLVAKGLSSEAGISYYIISGNKKGDSEFKKILSIRQLNQGEERELQENVSFTNRPQRQSKGFQKFIKFKPSDEFSQDSYLILPDRGDYDLSIFPMVIEAFAAKKTIARDDDSREIPSLFDKKIRQRVIAIPVFDESGEAKGVLLFRRSKIGENKGDQVEEFKIKIAEYLVKTFAEILPSTANEAMKNNENPEIFVNSAPEDFSKREKFNRNFRTLDFAISFLTDVSDLWMQGIKEHSSETESHVKNVAELAVMITEEINAQETGPFSHISIAPKEIRLFELGAKLHDFGKLYTPIRILETGVPVPGDRHELSKKDSEIMERHAEHIYYLLDIPGNKYIEAVKNFAGAHHVNANGKGGYPERMVDLLEGRVPFEAKILAIADIFEALTAKRNYREHIGLPPSVALQIMSGMAQSGKIDAAIFRLCVERDVFSKFAGKVNNLSRHDEELFEKLSLRSHDVIEITSQKVKLVNDEILRINDTLEKEGKPILTPDSAAYKAKRMEIFDAIRAGDSLFEEKHKAYLQKVIEGKLKTDDIDYTKIREFRDYIFSSYEEAKFNNAYIKKIMALNERQTEDIDLFKVQLAKKLSSDLGEEIKIDDIERSVEQNLISTRAFSIEASPPLSFSYSADKAEKICAAIIKIMEVGTRETAKDTAIGEVQKYQEVKKKILEQFKDAVPSPLERLTLFTSRIRKEEIAIS